MTDDPAILNSSRHDPAAEEVSRRLVAQLEELNGRLAKLDRLQESFETFGAVACDVLDERAQGLGETGSGADERLAGLTQLAERLTRRDTLSALVALADRAPELERLAALVDSAPDLVATLIDVIDEWARRCGEEGLDVAEALRSGLRTALWLGQRISEVELERLGFLLRSDVLDPSALQVVGNAATALVQCQRDACEAPSPRRAGAFASLRSLSDPKTQQSIAFALQFSRAFGELVGQPCSNSSPTPKDSE
ncbi:hypothetical protein Mal64_21090 [Pseudobythopirellula maris]|uniref:DUF1641 domain-containing protein n=1 Tax=Pseudobythopirellula maris TaxID=2527991 RepID=A0A5C5ZMC8_9BACT|nr:DUF1641 domain-containing protein [Pseudobythopirellula maris]TWT88624.1 hypothetical protein Mal64_21090 [Pseudobythopirellula maris]